MFFLETRDIYEIETCECGLSHILLANTNDNATCLYITLISKKIK